MASAKTADGSRPGVIAVALEGRDAKEVSSANPLWDSLRATTAQVVVSMPMTTEGTTLDRAATGEDTARWRTLATTLAGMGPQPAVVRLTPPPDADAAVSRQAAERVAATLKAATPGVLVEWSAPVGTKPGKATELPRGVDLVGVTLPTDAAWPAAVNREGGLSDWSDWAAQQGKRLAVTWAIDAGTQPWTVRSIRAWLDVTAQARRIGVETVRIAADANPEAVTAYREAW